MTELDQNLISERSIISNDRLFYGASLTENSYENLFGSIARFRRAGGKQLDPTDCPSTYFFKILFGFSDGADSDTLYENALLNLEYDMDATGLDSLPWETNVVSDPVQKGSEEKSSVNTAFNYLLLNGEYERAQKLEMFVNLLADINMKSPWYFSQISGLQEALNRAEFGLTEERKFNVDTKNSKVITIKCLPDAYDNRIGVLLDLYREITASYHLRKEIIPSNLRKFDMQICIFHSPIGKMHGNEADTYYSGTAVTLDKSSEPDSHRTSVKILEFKNCEFDYNSSATAYENVSNSEGFQMEYTVKIFYDSVYETRYDETTAAEIGDYILWDYDCSLKFGSSDTYETQDRGKVQEYKDMMEAYKNDRRPEADGSAPKSKLLSKAKDVVSTYAHQTVGKAVNRAGRAIESAVTGGKSSSGNFSINRLASGAFNAARSSVSDAVSGLKNSLSSSGSAIEKMQLGNFRTGRSPYIKGVTAQEEKPVSLGTFWDRKPSVTASAGSVRVRKV